jgi:hypothetical protein
VSQVAVANQILHTLDKAIPGKGKINSFPRPIIGNCQCPRMSLAVAHEPLLKPFDEVLGGLVEGVLSVNAASVPVTDMRVSSACVQAQ